MFKRTISLAVILALVGAGAGLGAARPSAPAGADASSAAVLALSDQPRLSTALEEWLVGLGVLPPRDAFAICPDAISARRNIAATILEEAAALSRRLSRWIAAQTTTGDGAADRLHASRQRTTE